MYTKRDRERLKMFYRELVERYGEYEPQAVSWQSEFSRDVRLTVLSEVGNLDNRSILDVGCGFGDLYGTIRNKAEFFDYTGIDINPAFISAAQKRFPGVEFRVEDFAESNQIADFVLASGALSFKVADFKDLYFEMIQKMFGQAKIATAFNMLNEESHVNDDTFAAYSVREVYDFCSRLSDRVTVRQDYLPHDFTVFIYK